MTTKTTNRIAALPAELVAEIERRAIERFCSDVRRNQPRLLRQMFGEVAELWKPAHKSNSVASALVRDRLPPLYSKNNASRHRAAQAF